MMRIAVATLLTVCSLSAYANFNPMDMEKFSPVNPEDARVVFQPSDKPVTVAELGEFVIVNSTKSDKCPSGGFYLVNVQRKTYQFVDAGTCEASVTVKLATPPSDKFSLVTQTLTFTRGSTITAKYPLYGY